VEGENVVDVRGGSSEDGAFLRFGA
jgi:hypothetical protein